MISSFLNPFSKPYFYSIIAITLLSCDNNKIENQNTKGKTPNTSYYKPHALKDTIGGVYHEYYKNGNVKVKGIYKNGKRDGDWSYFYENGKLWSWGEYTLGQRNGASSVYYENGVIRMEGNYFNNKQVGLWKFYNQQGKLVKEVQM